MLTNLAEVVHQEVVGRVNAPPQGRHGARVSVESLMVRFPLSPSPPLLFLCIVTLLEFMIIIWYNCGNEGA